MLVRISASPSGPLSVIGDLPVARLAILEGYNGIGKTLAVRILQLCTGTMPYASDSAAWESLREGLGHIEVEITGLQGADRVVWVADSADWGHDPVPRAEWFKSITIDGKPASLDDVRHLITVFRLAGDEDLTETFASQAEDRAAVVHRWRAKHAASEQGPLKQLEDLAGAADDLLQSVSIKQLAELKDDADLAKQALAETRDAVNELQQRREMLNEALDLRRRVSDMRAREPELQRELTEINEQITQKRSELEAAQKQVTRLAARVGRTEALDKELENAERTLLRNIKKLQASWSSAAAQAAALEVEPDTETVDELFEELTQQEEQLENQHHEHYQAPAMMQLLGTLSDELSEAESKGLADQVAVDDAESGTQLTVSQTRAGMVTRHGFLEQQPPPAKAVEILQELERVSHRKERVESLLEELDEVERFQRLVNHNEDRVRKALQRGAGGEAAEKLEKANKHRSECDQALLGLATQRAAVAQRLGSAGSDTSQQALQGQLDSDLESLRIPEEQLESEASAMEQLFAAAEEELAEANRRARDCRQRLAHERAGIRNAIELLDSNADLRWVGEALDRRQPASAGSIDHLHRDLVAAQNVVRGVLDRLGKHRTDLEAVEMALQGTARQLQGQSVNATEYVEQLQGWLAALFSDWFNDPRVRSELLNNADRDQEVTVDVSTRRVLWSENRTRRSRPLEAFSSGEQAFAYTRARLAVLDDADPNVTNRLIVLDEFGAFIAQHLFRGMLDYLKEWTGDRQSDQVLLILPLGRDYSQLAESAVGGRAKRYATLARHVDERGYVTRTIVR